TTDFLRRVVDSLPEGTERPNLDNLQLYKPGSSPANPYGYRSQLPIREQFIMTPAIRQLFEHPGRVISTEEIEDTAVHSGMRTMQQDAVLKVIAGQTTLEEIYRVLG